MKYTNKHDYPWYIAVWLLKDEYDYRAGTYSATQLIRPARETVLCKNAIADGVVLEMDLSELFAAKYGTMVHDSISKEILDYNKNPAGYIDKVRDDLVMNLVFGQVNVLEERYQIEIEGSIVTGKPDLVTGGIVHDFKTTSTFKYMNKNFDDYIQQLSIYRYILENNGIFTPQMGVIDFIFTDWRASEAANKDSYPQSRYAKQRIHLLSSLDTENLIKDRIAAIKSAEKSLPECTDEELWKEPDVYAHMREKKVRAIKLYGTESECQAAVESDDGKKGKPYVEFRKGLYKRCKYCQARTVCSQYKEFKSQNLIKE